MKTATPRSPYRSEARAIIAQVIEDNVRGAAQCLPRGDVLELRRKLREAYPFVKAEPYPYRVWCQEVRHALGYPVKLPARKSKPRIIPAHKILPSMLAWAKERGLVEDSRVE
jgi:hypothetical protein